MKNNAVLIVGGGGAMGTLFQRELAASGALLQVADRTNGDDLDAAWSPTFQQRLREADMVIVALPETAALRHASALLQQMRPDALWVDTLSIKGPIAGILSEASQPAERVSINPMFAPSLGFRGQNIAWVPVSEGPLSEQLYQWLRQAGAELTKLSAAEHDQLTAATQVATHAAVLAYGLALRELNYDPTLGAALATPPHRLLQALLARMANGNPEVYWDIQQHHPHAAATREALRRSLNQLNIELPEFCQLISQLKATTTKDSAALAERLIRSLD
jgi:4-amino-4-deoxyprephenate dehydrogenase